MKEPKHSSKAAVEKKAKQPKQWRYSTKVRVITSIGSSILAILGVLCIALSIFIISIFSRVTFHEGEVPYDPNVDIEFEEEEELEGEVVDPDEFTDNDSLSSIPVRGNGDGVRNILLLGIDGEGYSGRADTTMILSINDNDKTIKLVSLQRDTFVTIPGRDKNGDGEAMERISGGMTGRTSSTIHSSLLPEVRKASMTSRRLMIRVFFWPEARSRSLLS